MKFLIGSKVIELIKPGNLVNLDTGVEVLMIGSSGDPIHFSSTGTKRFNALTYGISIANGAGLYASAEPFTGLTEDYALLFDPTMALELDLFPQSPTVQTTITHFELKVTTTWGAQGGDENKSDKNDDLF